MEDALSGPAGSGAVVAASQWLQGTLLGTLATTVAVIAVAWIGFGMLSGRVDIRRGVTVVLGCFVVFGAQTIAAGLMGLGGAGGGHLEPVAVVVPPIPPMPALPTPPAYDPYAGASVPKR